MSRVLHGCKIIVIPAEIKKKETTIILEYKWITYCSCIEIFQMRPRETTIHLWCGIKFNESFITLKIYSSLDLLWLLKILRHSCSSMGANTSAFQREWCIISRQYLRFMSFENVKKKKLLLLAISYHKIQMNRIYRR